jgi:hypothetical protein
MPVGRFREERAMGDKAYLNRCWMVLRLLVLCFSFLAISPDSSFNYGGLALAGDNACTAPASSCGCATCGCGEVKTPSCPPGQTLYNDYCLPSCPSGFVRYPGMPGLCVPPCDHGCPVGYDQIPLPECPQGFHRDLRDPNVCTQDPGQLTYGDECPFGMAYAPETGKCEVECPSGTFLNGNGLCESYYERECPKGYGRDPESGKCLPPGTWPVGYKWVCLPHCPDGTYRDINQPTRCIPPKVSCPQGYDNVQGRCLPVCEQGTQRDSYGYCYPPEKCPDGSYTNLRGQCEQPKCPRGNEIYDGQCTPICEQGWTRNDNGRCTPPDDGCDQGQELFRGQCVPICKQGLRRDNNGRCVPPQTGCPQGQEEFRGQCVPICKQGLRRDNNGRCVPPQTGCPRGQEEFRGQCVPLCAQGTNRDDNGRCVQPRKNCPKNTIYNAKRNKCEPIRVQLPECDQGEIRDRNGRCVPVNNEPDCGKGERLNENGECVPIRLVPQACPRGTYYEPKRKACLPIPQQQTDPAPQDELIDQVPGIKVDPGLIQKLIPRGSQDGNQNNGIQSNGCKEGMFLDRNGRCVESQ